MCNDSDLIPLRTAIVVNEATYSVVGLLGRGYFGAVSHIRRKLPSGKIQNLALKEQKRTEGENELKMLLPLQDRDHPHIVRLFGFGPVGENFILALEHARYGDLETYVRKDEYYMEKKKARAFYGQLLRGIHFLHSHRVAHLDIKPVNVLVMSSGHCRITDFGVSALMTEEGLCRPAGSIAYQPPEHRGGPYRINGMWQDLWGAALIYVFMVIADTPWTSASPENTQYGWFRQGRIFRHGNDGWARFQQWDEYCHLQRLLHHHPDRRLVPAGYSDELKDSFAGLP
ncbi:hypothetical protein L596_018625 [Steinernema carpocapsae]|uniref:Protein kinase domain-containing protein n=1 Tax=Steinernema carpocapsae TaxID=34508 RepID=A0A4U5N614_STECR|nr:hypothetical protein L596_018625 [Steinernema carpocapsae]